MVPKIISQALDACCGSVVISPSGVKMQLPWMHNQDQKIHNNTTPTPPKKKQGKFTEKEMKYELTQWKMLPLKVRKACQDLGYDQAKWDNAEEIDYAHKHWHDLTDAELTAVQTLGWEREAWEHRYEHHAFKDLPEAQKRAAEALGMGDEHKWEHWPHELEHKYWNDLTESEKQALAVLGWHRNVWDH